MQVRVTRIDEKTVQLVTDQPDQLTLACLEVGRVFKVGVKIQIDDMPIGQTLLVDTSTAASKG